MALDVMEAILERRSIRKYKDIPVEQDKMVTILEAGRQAPSAGNVQDWKFIYVTEKDQIKKIAEACMKQYWIETAPLLIVIVSNPEKSIQHYGERGKMYAIQNCAAACQNMLLAATSAGLASCWISAFDEPMLKDVLSIPARGTPMAVLTFGYADEEVPRPFKTPLESIVFIQRYANRARSPELVRWDIAAAMEKGIKRNVENVKRSGRRFGQKLFGKAKELKERAKEGIEEEKQ